ncbi:Zn-dependent hydrolase [Polymorphobacter arshaanensis]|uniref:Zn-dependent hydrolase n=2 Tax=Glacieibacterium arshaanense TaxID=2511025 RepID=A0A4Y9ETT4_9SPHN|nr:Zn-dependent hydrolase [Polymorphobacter arshaanensis]
MLAAAAAVPLAVAATGAAPAVRVNGPRLETTLEQLSTFGRPPGTGFEGGVNRTAYSDADIAGRAYVMGLMRDAGLNPVIDPAGNIIGRRAGTKSGLKPIIIGSHIDSVRAGGNFDGDLGSMGALEVLRTLDDHGLKTRHPVEMAIWSNEEGGTCGSTAFAGKTAPGALDNTYYGITLRDGLKRIGGDPDRLAEAARAPGSIHTYLELHIEQGGILAKAGIPIGVVDGIVAIDRYDVEIKGFANHAGTTPMAGRHNALIAASQLVLAVDTVVKTEPGRQVGTVGQLAVFPNAPNVIPGRVTLTVELRDLSEAKVAALGQAVQARAREIATATGTEIVFHPTEQVRAALANPAVQAKIEAAAKQLGLAYMHLPSGAGHDAQLLAFLGPMGMIFVPSVAGISHSPKELTAWSDCANGANVLLQTLLAVDAG